MRLARLIAHTPIARRKYAAGRAELSGVRSKPLERAVDVRKEAAHLVEDSDGRWPDPLERDDGAAWSWRGGM
jgi:hypothetical protein